MLSMMANIRGAVEPPRLRMDEKKPINASVNNKLKAEKKGQVQHMKTYYLISLYGGLFNAAYIVQATDYDDMVEKSLAYFKEIYSPFDSCMFGGSVYFLNDDSTWIMDEEADHHPDKFEIIVFEQKDIAEIGSIEPFCAKSA